MNRLIPRRPFEDWITSELRRDFMSDVHQIFHNGTQQLRALEELYTLGYEQRQAEVDQLKIRILDLEKVLQRPITVVVSTPTFFERIFARKR